MRRKTSNFQVRQDETFLDTFGKFSIRLETFFEHLLKKFSWIWTIFGAGEKRGRAGHGKKSKIFYAL